MPRSDAASLHNEADIIANAESLGIWEFLNGAHAESNRRLCMASRYNSHYTNVQFLTNTRGVLTYTANNNICVNKVFVKKMKPISDYPSCFLIIYLSFRPLNVSSPIINIY